MEFAVLGPLEVRTALGPVKIRRGLPRTLLIALLLRSGQTVSSDLLVDLLWGDGELPRNPANALQVQVSYLRRALATSAPGDTLLLETRAGGYSLLLDGAVLDAYRFESAVKRTAPLDTLRAPEQLSASLEHLDAALGLWRGDALEDVSGMNFARGEITRLEELRWGATERRIDLMLRLGRHSEVVGDLSELVQRLPFRERFHQQRMLALYRSGRQAEALRAYDEARSTLHEELGLEPGAELRELQRAVLHHDPSLDWTSPASALVERGEVRAGPVDTQFRAGPTAGRIPVPLSPLIGRDREVRRLAELLKSHRALTLTGPAGAGKTRLAIALAAQRTEPVWYVDFSPIDDPALVGSICAAALGVTLSAGENANQAVADTLASQRGTLVLDTCEHMLLAAGQLAAAVLRVAPAVHVLATSRRALGLTGELAWPVPPLALPPTDAVSVDEMTSHDAVRLFVDRAQSARPDLELNDDVATDIAAICRALDGLPLAIELAAARTDLLSPAAIRSRLVDRFDLLVEGGIDASERQQTLRSAIDWSFELLNDEQRTFFARLAVFAGTFDLDAALYVAGAGLPRPLELLSSLVKQSMVASAGADRFRLLDTLRAYAHDVLAELDADDTRARHAMYFTEVAEQGEVAIRGAAQLAWLNRFRADVNNFRASLEWSLSTGDVVQAAREAGALAWFWTLDGMLIEAVDHLEGLIEREDIPPATRSRCLRGYALLAASLGQLEGARESGYLAADLGRQAADPLEAAYALNAAAVAEWALGQHQRSLQAHAEAIRLLARIEDQWGLAICKVLQARTLFDQGDSDAAQVAREGVQHARRAGDLHVLGIALTATAQMAIADGDSASAVSAATEALELQERIGYTEGTISALHVLGHAHRLADRADHARRLHRRALSLASGIGHAAATCEALEDLARIEADERPALAATLLRAARVERKARGLPQRQRDAEDLAALEKVLSTTGADATDIDRPFAVLVAELTV